MTTSTDTTDDTFELATPIETLTSDVTHIPQHHADIAAAMASTYPPTNQRLIAKSLGFWVETAGPNDPISRSMASWLAYLVNDDVTQLAAGMTMDQHDALLERLDELGIEVDE